MFTIGCGQSLAKHWLACWNNPVVNVLPRTIWMADGIIDSQLGARICNGLSVGRGHILDKEREGSLLSLSDSGHARP
jgi:hypothetical protein